MWPKCGQNTKTLIPNNIGPKSVWPKSTMTAVQSLAASQETSRIFVSRIEPGSHTQAIASDKQCTCDKAGFKRIGGPTKVLHESGPDAG